MNQFSTTPTFQSTWNIPELLKPISPYMSNLTVNTFLAEIEAQAILIEKGIFKPFNRDKQKMPTPSCSKFFSQLRNLQQLQRDFTLTMNPYLQVLFEDMILPDHHFQYSDPTAYITETHSRLQRSILSNKCALHAQKHRDVLNKEVTFQKSNFTKLLKLHEQVDCYFLELPSLYKDWSQTCQTTEEKERLFVEATKNFLHKSHQSQSFHEKLCNMQWRVVKGLNGNLVAQVVMYVTGNSINYESEFQTLWASACSEKDPSLNAQAYIQSMFCYTGGEQLNKQWKHIFDQYQLPLKLYYYQSRHVSYMWKEYTGNV